MHIAAKLAIGAGLIGAGALALAACGNTSAPQEPKLADDDVMGAADRATDTDASMLRLLAMNASSRFTPREYVSVLDAADGASDTDAALMSLVSIGDHSNAPVDKVIKAFADADRATDTDSAAISVVYDALRAYEASYPTPDEIPGSGNYPTGGTSGGDENAAAGTYEPGHAPQGGDPAADAAR